MSSTQKTVTRFAPSPTGFLHIGGARTALFNWLYSKHTGGKFLLRIEDTDRERSTDAAIAAIIDGLKWLELDWDGEPVMQFQRVERHREAVEELLKRGNAYRCYCTPDDLDAMRKQAEAEGKPPIYNGLWRDRDPSEAPAGVKPAIRLKTPRSGETVIEDQVQGRVVFQNENLDDLIILRSDGTPTYNLAVVVDDHDMGVTHVIRGVDHLTNAARQTQIYLGLGWDVPSFAHVPLIHGPDGAKLSKRHGALGVEAYRAMGYLPAALRNYLVRLGWSHGNEEIIPLDKMVEWFDLDGVGRSPARFDFAKLEDLNGHYIRQTSESELLDRIRQALPEMENGPELEAKFAAAGWDKLAAALPSLKQRAKTLKDLVDGASYVIAERPLPLDDKAAKLLTDDARALLTTLLPRLEAAEWTATSIEAEVRRFAEETGAKLGSVAQPLRAALTGRSVSPPVFDVMAVLGRDEALARIRDQAAAH
ncbi:glutamate--tRNA ligase [Leptospira interrogans]